MARKKKMPTPSKAPVQHAHASVPDRIPPRIAAAFIVIAAARAVAGFIPGQRLWGLDHLAYIGLPGLDVILAALAIAAALRYPRPFERVAAALFGERGGTASRAILCALLAGVLFWFFRMKTYFLGDGAVYLAEHYRYVHGLPVSEDVLFSRLSGPLTGAVLAYAAKLFAGLSAEGDAITANPQFTWWALGALAGAVYVAVAVRTAWKLGHDPAQRAGFLLLLLTTPGVLFFFGYVEYYTFHFTAIMAALFLSSRAVEGKISPLAPAAALALAIGFHFMALIAVPGLLVVFASRSRHASIRALARPTPVAWAIGSVLLVSGIWYFASGIAWNGSRVVLPLVPYGHEGAMQSYTLLSSYHLVDTVNYLFLIGAPVLAGIALLWRRGLLAVPEVLVAAVNAVFFAFLLFFGNLTFGMARDWDVNASFGLALIFLLIAVARHVDPSVRLRHVLWAVAASSAIGAVGWYAVNIDASASVERYRAILQLDASHMAGDYALNGYEHLRKWYFSEGDAAGTAWAIRRKIECVGYPADYRKLVNTAVQDLPPAAKRAEFDWIFDHLRAKLRDLRAKGADSSYAGSREEFAEIAAEAVLTAYTLPQSAGLGEEYAREQGARLEEIEPGFAPFGIVAGQMEWDRTGRIADPSLFSRGGDALHWSATLALAAGRALVFARQYDDAVRILSRGYAMDTTFTLPLLFLAEAEYRQSPANAPKVREHLERFLSDPSGHRLANDPASEQKYTTFARSLLATVGG